MQSIASTGRADCEKPGGGPSRTAFSVPEVAHQLGLSEASIWRALKRGQFESVMTGGRRVIPAHSVDKVLAASHAA